MIQAHELDDLTPQQLRELTATLLGQVSELGGTVVRQRQDILVRQTRIDQLTHELAVLKRWKFGRRSEQLDANQASLLDEDVAGDLVAIEEELHQLAPPASAEKVPSLPRRQPLPAQFQRTLIHHEPTATTCGCGCALKRIGEDVSEKLDYTPGVFTVEKHIRGKWVCSQCETLIQAPVPAHVIDKGLATTGLLAQVLVAKHADHLPLYRQESIFARAGLALSRSTLSEWVGVCGVRLQPLVDALRADILKQGVLHADETPVQMLAPGKKKTHRAYLWAYAPTRFSDLHAVVYDFAESRAGSHARDFLQDWQGKLVCDDYAGYKAGFALGITEIGCMAHARRKFFDLHAANKSQVAEQALKFFAALYDIERGVLDIDHAQRFDIRQAQAKPVADALHAWMLGQRQRVPEGSAIAKALDYSLKRWVALVRYLEDGNVPIDNNWIENQIRPWAIGRSNWLFAGSLRAGKRAAAITSLIQSAKLNGHDPYAYLKDVLTRLPTHANRDIADLLPHRWQPKS